jgi:hypothetical protein
MSAAAVIAIRVRRIFAFLRARQAVSPERAIPESEVPYSDRWYFRRLVRAGAVKRTDSGCYLDEAAAQAHRRARRIRALVLLAVVLGADLLYVAFIIFVR